MRLSPTLLTRLGVPWLWGGDVEKGWVFMRFNAVPVTTLLMAPGSYAYGICRLPRVGGAVMAINHLSAIDPPLVGSFSNRAVWYMMKSELLERRSVSAVAGFDTFETPRARRFRSTDFDADRMG